VREEIRVAEADRRKPLRREQPRGPQHQVKPAASTELQRESRAAHVTAKAAFDARQSREQSVSSLSGVWGAARVEGQVRNVGDPSALPQSRQSGSYKPKAKLSAAQRESEGIVVPTMGVTKNTLGGKGPCFDPVEGGGKREGMTGRTSRSNHPDCSAVDKVLRLQERLWVVTKRTLREMASRSDTLTLLAFSRQSDCTTSLPERSSVSRVLEIGKHGLKGGPVSPLAAR